jgi:hypothetical protein
MTRRGLKKLKPGQYVSGKNWVGPAIIGKIVTIYSDGATIEPFRNQHGGLVNDYKVIFFLTGQLTKLTRKSVILELLKS